VAACQVVEEECEDEWNERRVNIPGISNVPTIAAMSGEMTGKKQNIYNNHTSLSKVDSGEVELLRDIGSSVSIVRSAIVAPEQYVTGTQISFLGATIALISDWVKHRTLAINGSFINDAHIKHRHISVKPNQQLSRLFNVAQTQWLVVVQLTFIDDDAT